MPRRDDFGPATASVGVRKDDEAKFCGGDGWRVDRVWGRLRLTPTDAQGLPAGYRVDVPLELEVDRVDPDPPFLPAAVAPATATAWALWALAAGLTGAAAGPIVRRARWLFGARGVARLAAITLVSITVATAVAWWAVPGVAGIDLYDGRSTLEAAAGRSGFFAHWTGDYSGYGIPPVRKFWFKDYDPQSAGRFGVGLRSYYTRYDWGNVHAHVDLAVSPVCLTGGFGLLAYLALRCSRRTRVTPGRCRSCGYDLRATPALCPECGRRVTS